MKKRRLRLLCLLMAASMTVPMPAMSAYAEEPSNVLEGAERVQPETREAVVEEAEDGIYDEWQQDADSVVGTGAVCGVENGWLHLKSDPGNGNNPKTKPAIFVNPKEFDFAEEGYFEFTMKTNNANSGSSDSDRFGVYLGYNTDQNGLFVGYDNGGWFWQKYKGGNGEYYQGKRQKAPVKGQEVKVKLEWTADYKVTLRLDDTVVFEKEDFSGIKDVLGKKIAFKCGSFGNQAITDVLITGIHYPGQETQKITTYTVSGAIKDEEGNPVKGANISIAGLQTESKEDGTWSLDGLRAGKYQVVVTKDGFTQKTQSIEITDKDLQTEEIILSSGEKVDYEASDTLSSSEMEVGIDDTFPRVVGYTMKGGKVDGKKFYGQTEKLTTLVLNQTKADDSTGITVTPEVKYEKVSENKAVYTMTVKDTASGIDATIKAEIVVEKNTLAFNITEVKNHEGSKNIVKTINIPNHNLVTVKSTQVGAKFDGANMSTNTVQSGDKHMDVTDTMGTGKSGYMYAFVSGGGLSAGLWSNSENNVTADWQRVAANVTEKDGHKAIGLSSNYWTYQKGEAYREENKDYELPSVKVAITGDQNGDDIVDWQDGAIAYREIMNNPVGSEKVPDLTAIRIAMNFSSQAQNPFLMTLDNVKKVYLNTDGLGQSVLLKGYGSEGHDSGHLNYADIGKRIGGVEDMKTLLKEGKKYGATFGIHVNASETYPESKYFDENRLLKKADGTYSYGWNWLDQGININADYDLRNGREQRFVDLYNELGGKDNDLDFIYVDVWGNGQSGDNGTWASRQLAKEITQTCGWRLAGEWGYANEYDSTFQHWAADLTYGGATLKGINSEITRFIRNHQKDSWVGDYPSYGGAAVNPLLGGYDMKDFEGWQGRNDYKGYIENLFDDNVATKFLQHYKVMKWEDGEETTVNGVKWTPEMRITLQDDSRKNTVVVERQSNNGSDPGYSLRTMTFNGRKIMDGEKYLIPWFWDENGETLKTEKLYHWNQAGGTSTWDLPSGWSNAKIYQLTENGKVEVKNATVNGGKITIHAEAKTPYVLYQTEAKNPTKEEMQWSIGTHLVDTGFNSNSLDQWKIEGEKEAAEIVKSAGNNSMLRLQNADQEVVLTQKMTDLEAGKQYVAMVAVDNRSDAKAYIEIKNGDQTIASNYTEKSIAQNYSQADAHNKNAATIAGEGSYFQNMYVFFTVPENGDVSVVLKREAGDGAAYFDDLRVVKNNSDNYKKDGTFVQNFEDVPQGLWPFVLGGAEGVTDNRTHLSEKHEPYTQAGWYTKKLDDVLEGTWSLKTNGLVRLNGIIYQTIPQNYRFEPGKTYNVSFDYELGSEGAYELVVGDGENHIVKTYPLECAIKDGKSAEVSNIRIRLTGAESGQSWIGIRSTSAAPDLQGTSGGDADFGGYKDFVLDNLKIEKSQAEKASLEKLVLENSGYHEENYTEKSWKTFTDALTVAQERLDDFAATQTQVDEAYKNLENAVNGLEMIGITLSGTVTDQEGEPVEDITVSVNMDGKEIYAVTNSRGEYTLPGVLFGEWEVKADSSLFKAQTQKLSASKEHPESTMDFQMEDTLTKVSGLVTEVGRPSEGAKVVIAGKGVEGEVTTKADGRYEITEVPAGKYSVTVTKEGYDTYSSEITVTKDKTFTKNIMLQPLSTVDYSNDYEDNKKTWDNLAGNVSSTSISMESGAVKVSFPGGGHANVYETNAPKFKNGVVEMDITPQKSGVRVGLLLRAGDMNNRIYVGVGDAENQWFAEYWGKSGNSWGNMHQGPAASAGKKMHVKAEIVDKTVTLWVNDQKVFTETMEGMPTDAGFVGLNTRNNNVLLVDNVKVTSYDAPEGEVQHVAGSVMNGNKPVEGAEVVLDSKEGSGEGAIHKTTKTDSLGNYKFKNIPAGEYVIRVTSGEQTKETTVNVNMQGEYAVAACVNFGESTSKPDKTGLITAINQAETLKEERYMPDGWKELQTVLKQAKEIYEKEDATVEEITLAEMQLTEAMNVLVERPDKTGLQAIVDAAKERKEADYTAESWKLFKEAVDAAETVLAKENAEKAEIISAGNAVLDAAEALVAVETPAAPDKTDLQDLVGKAELLREEDYTAESWTKFANALERAKAVLADEKATSEEVAQAQAELKAAQETLVAKGEEPQKPDKTSLETAIKEAEKLSEKEYTEESWKPFAEALEKAKAVLADENVVLKDVMDAEINLRVAQKCLVKKGEEPSQVDKTSLETALKEAQKLSAEDYTTVTWKIFRTAVIYAESVVKDENATAEEVARAELGLKVTQNWLVQKKEADKTMLKALVEKAETLSADDYTEGSFKILKTALQGAKEVLSDEKATECEVCTAEIRLHIAMESLVEKGNEPEKADKTNLKKAVQEAEKLQKSDYTAESWETFAKALEKAKEVIADEKATTEEVTEAEIALKTAQTNLVMTESKDDENQKPETEGDHNQTKDPDENHANKGNGNSSGNHTSGTKEASGSKGKVATGDEAPVIPAAGGLFVSLAAIAAILFKKRK